MDSLLHPNQLIEGIIFAGLVMPIGIWYASITQPFVRKIIWIWFVISIFCLTLIVLHERHGHEFAPERWTVFSKHVPKSLNDLLKPPKECINGLNVGLRFTDGTYTKETKVGWINDTNETKQIGSIEITCL